VYRTFNIRDKKIFAQEKVVKVYLGRQMTSRYKFCKCVYIRTSTLLVSLTLSLRYK